MTTVIICRPPITRSVPDPKAVKSRQQAAWSSSDHDGSGMTLQVIREQLAEGLDLRARQDVLETAPGSGNVANTPAHHRREVSSTNESNSLPASSRKRAEAERPHNEGNLARRGQLRDQINALFSITAVPGTRPNEGS